MRTAASAIPSWGATTCGLACGWARSPSRSPHGLSASRGLPRGGTETGEGSASRTRSTSSHRDGEGPDRKSGPHLATNSLVQFKRKDSRNGGDAQISRDGARGGASRRWPGGHGASRRIGRRWIALFRSMSSFDVFRFRQPYIRHSLARVAAVRPHITPISGIDD